MAIATDYGPLDESDECDHPSHCDREAVAQVPAPNVLGGFRFCDVHLALWADTKGDWTTLQELGIQHLAADDRFLSVEAAPPKLEREVTYRRIGVDHRGLAHYYVVGRPDQDADRVITVDAQLQLEDAYDVPPHVGLEGWVDHVDERRCWIQLDDRFSDSGGDGR